MAEIITGLPCRWIVASTCMLLALATSGTARGGPDGEARVGARIDSFDSPTEPSALLSQIEERRTQKDSLFSVAPLGWLRDGTAEATQELREATGLELGVAFAHVFQAVSETIEDQDDAGTATTMDLVGTWNLLNEGEPSQGQAVFHVQSRWDYGTTGPEDLGASSLGSVIGTADTYSAYRRAFVLRNLYWRQGSPEAGWVYRIGKITPDALLGSSLHLDSQTTFLSSGGTGPFAIALPDSGLGAVGAWYFNDRVALAGLVSDANADRFDSGDIAEGDFFKAAELHVKIAPRTPNAGFSKLTLWHNDGTDDGASRNGMAGPSGWGFFAQHEQELTDDGRAVAIVRYGRSFDDAAVYDQQAGAHFLLYEPRFVTRLENDVVGLAFNWVDSVVPGARDEYNVETFYRFPIFPEVDTTLSYQSVINPALTREVDHASVFSLRIRMTF